MMFNYKNKLEKYKEYINYLNENAYDTNKIIGLVNYAKDYGIIDNKNILYGELNAIYDFYNLDMIKSIEHANNTSNEDEKNTYLNRAKVDLLFLNEISDNGYIKEKYDRICNYLNRLKKIEKSIKEEDRIELKR